MTETVSSGLTVIEAVAQRSHGHRDGYGPTADPADAAVLRRLGRGPSW